MKLKLIRKTFTDNSTIGELHVDDKLECYTLEDVIRAKKIKHETAIPYGTYEVIVNFSNRFQEQMPLLLNVQGFEGIRIHRGNTASNTSGCILLGQTKGNDFIGQSKLAYDKFFTKLRAALKKGKVFIEIVK